MKGNRRKRAQLAGAISALLLANASLSQDQPWIPANAPLTFTVSYPSLSSDTAQGTHFRFFINQNDVTPLVRQSRASADSQGTEHYHSEQDNPEQQQQQHQQAQWTYDSRRLALPSGDVQLQVFIVNGEEWQEVSTQYFKVLTKHGFERASVTASTSLTLDAQFDAGAKGDAFEPDEKRKANGSGFINISSDHARGDLEIQTSSNFSGASRHENALRYYEEGESAPKLDLSDYVVSVNKGKASIRVGHISSGTNPLLVNGLSNRGVSVNYAVNRIINVGIAAQNGSTISGWENISGLENSRHQILSSSVSVELAPEAPGSQRLEFSLLSGKTQSIGDFGVGEITDAEENTGWGISYQARIFEQRLQIDSAYAQSEYQNIQDQFLAQGDALVVVDPSTDTAWHADIRYDAISPNYENSLRNFATSLHYRKERADALYRSLAAYVNADSVQESFDINGQIQYLNWSVALIKNEDNVDDIPTILKTGTRNLSANIQFNIADWLGSDAAETEATATIFWPTVVISSNRLHQRALNAPVNAFSDFNDTSHLPDQKTYDTNIGLNWSAGNSSYGYSFSTSKQDNRQTGREDDDFERLSHSINTSHYLFDQLSTSVSFGRATNLSIAEDIEYINTHGNIQAQWQLPRQWVVEGAYALNEDTTNIGLSRSDSTSISAGLSHNWQWARGNRSVDGQWFIRYSRQENTNEDSVFNFATSAETWVWTGGLTVSF